MIRIVVIGEPAPQGSKRFVGIAKGTGRGILIESSKKVKPWRQCVVTACAAVIDVAESVGGKFEQLDGPLRCTMVFTLPKPQSAPKTKRTYPHRKPDLSKLARSTEDALVTSGIIADDARIVEYALAKRFPHEGMHSLSYPGAYIELEQIGYAVDLTNIDTPRATGREMWRA
jgi:crossover junction endodeoxyribonuclease RusA